MTISVKACWHNPPENYEHPKMVENKYLSLLLGQVGGNVGTLKEIHDEACRRPGENSSLEKMHALAVVGAFPETQAGDWEDAKITLEFQKLKYSKKTKLHPPRFPNFCTESSPG